MSNTIYTIGTKQHNSGHGDFFTSIVIARTGSYGQGEYPPYFETREDAEAFIAQADYPLRDGVVVEIHKHQ